MDYTFLHNLILSMDDTNFELARKVYVGLGNYPQNIINDLERLIIETQEKNEKLYNDRPYIFKTDFSGLNEAYIEKRSQYERNILFIRFLKEKKAGLILTPCPPSKGE